MDENQLFWSYTFLLILTIAISEFFIYQNVIDYNNLEDKYNILVNKSNDCQEAYSTIKNAVEKTERMEMYVNNSPANFTNGVYFSARGYYCVWTKDRPAWAIDSTECHEKCHVLTDRNRNDTQYGHFCG